MKQQQRFDFGKQAAREPEWAGIIAGNPTAYPALLVKAALIHQHKAGKPHDSRRCPLCAPQESAA